MDAKQTKQLIATAQRAAALLNPDWPIFAELTLLLAQAKLPAPAQVKARRKSSKIPFACNAGATPWAVWPPTEYPTPSRTTYNITVKARELGLLDALPTAEGLETCACGHGAEAHHEDELNNLLRCEHFIAEIGEQCACDHFHYSPSVGVANQREAA